MAPRLTGADHPDGGAVVKIAEANDRSPDSSRDSFSSFALSLLFHALLAFLLWGLVYNVVKRQSITLSASAASPTESLLFEVSDSVELADPLSIEGDDSASRSRASVAAMITNTINQQTLADVVPPNLEPPSIEFFGTRAYGNKFVFVLDISYSMDARNGERFRRACDELVRSASQMRAGQSYFVYLFCWNTQSMFYGSASDYIRVVPGHESKLRKWIYDVTLGAGTDPRRALSLAHRMKPDAIFLLSDGQFNYPSTPLSESGWISQQEERLLVSVQEGIELLFQSIPIHTIAFENPYTRSAMQQVAQTTHGTFRYIKTRSHEPTDPQRFLTALRYIDQKHRHDTNPRREYTTRLSSAREMISDGELAYAEYIARPVRYADPSLVANPKLQSEVFEILDAELGKTRLEDFEEPPELSKILAKDAS